MTRERYLEIEAMTPDGRAKLARPEQDEYESIVDYRNRFGERVYNYALTLMSQRDMKAFDDMLKLYDKHGKTLRLYAKCVTDATDLARKMDDAMSPERTWGTKDISQNEDEDAIVEDALTVEKFHLTVLLPGSALNSAILRSRDAARAKIGNDIPLYEKSIQEAKKCLAETSDEDRDLASISVPWLTEGPQSIDRLVSAYEIAFKRRVIVYG